MNNQNIEPKSKSEPFDMFKWFIEKAKLTAMPHQTQAVKWMTSKEKDEKNTVKGGILADEMGLGKTIMMIGLFISNFVKKTLIVVPAPLVNQWATEIKRTTGHNILVWNKKVPLEVLLKAPFVITTYNKIAKSEASGDNLNEIQKISRNK